MTRTEIRNRRFSAATFAFAAALLLCVSPQDGGSALFAANSGTETILVYPASATSKVPETIQVPASLPSGAAALGGRASAVRPVQENGELDPETPLGQVRSVLSTLGELRDRQLVNGRALNEAVAKIESTIGVRADELAETLNLNALRLASLEAAIVGPSKGLGTTGRRPSREPTVEVRPGGAATPIRPAAPYLPLGRILAFAGAAIVLWELSRRRAVANFERNSARARNDSIDETRRGF
ncbi:MAG: hypothetical protein ACOX0A_07135 [Thermoguttaceae bacterium]|jgi:hypothetical protein